MLSIKNFNAQVADYSLRLPEISLAKGEVTLLFGPSGSGKTSFLMGLLGMIKAEYSLNIPLEGKSQDLGKMPAKDKNFGVVFQFENLFDHISVYRNLYLVKNQNQSEEKFRTRIEAYGIASLLEKKAAVLSGGEQQMVACVRLFLQENKNLILLDEPWSAMDPENKTKYRQELLRHIKETDVPCVIVSHDVDEALYLSPRFTYDFNQVAFFEKGQP